MKDNTVTVHPTVKTSTVYALELIAEEYKISLGKAIEMILEKDQKFQEFRDFYKKEDSRL